MTSFGVPLGATMPNQPEFSKPLSVLPMGGTPGSWEISSRLVTPSARSRPLLTCTMAPATVASMKLMSPPTRLASPGPSPLYGTCTASIFAWYRRFSAASAAAVLDDHALPPELRQLLTEEPRRNVGRAARREGHDELHRFLRPGLRPGCNAQQRGEQERSRSHADPPSVCRRFYSASAN